MSTVCILGHPAAGHINSTLPVAAELVRRGERVVYYATEPFRARIERTGALFRSYGEQALFERNLAIGGMLGGMAGLIQTTEEIFPQLLEDVRANRPDYLLVEAHAVWGNLLAQVLGLRTAALCSMFAINEELISPAELIGHLYGAAPREAAAAGLRGLTSYFEVVRRLDRRCGTRSPGVVNYLGNRQALNIVLTAREFQVNGKVFDDTYKFVGPSISAREEELNMDFDERGGGPIIYISMGTMYNEEADFYRVCFAAFGDRPFRVILAVGHRVDRSRLPSPPSNFTVREYVPQLAVLQRADLFITHGGINSAHEGMWYGVPMIVLPQTADHYIVASQVEAAGAGLVLDRSLAGAGQLVELATRVLGDGNFKRRSAELGEHLKAAGGHVRAVDEILAMRLELTEG